MKKLLIIGLAVVLVLAVLFVPIPRGTVEDGGTRVYQALTYKIVDWNRIYDEGVYQNTKVYWLGDSRKDLDELWEQEQVYSKFIGKVLEISQTGVLLEPMEWEWERSSASLISVTTTHLEPLQVAEGSYVEITYDGQVMESYPAMVNAVSWKMADDLRQMAYPGTWMKKDEDTKYNLDFFKDVRITAVYSDCFMAVPVIPMPYTVKINGTLSDQWCVGDQVEVTYENLYYDPAAGRAEADMLSIKESTFRPDPEACYKPVIYLYPEQRQDVSVTLDLQGTLTCTYPAYREGWKVTAHPDGTLTDAQGQSYNYLYWEGLLDTRYDLTTGFCVPGEETAQFLEWALERLGLNRREANEFIVYWLPLMEGNPYNLISFQTEAYQDAARLEVEPAPDTLIRVFMAWQASDCFTVLPAQELTAPQRKGFTVVEWGGAQVQ